MTVFTLGHSTRSIDAFLAMLHGHGVQSLLDVRTVPKSRHNPQFAREALAPALRASGSGPTSTHAVSLPSTTRCTRSQVVNGRRLSTCGGTSARSMATSANPPA